MKKKKTTPQFAGDNDINIGAGIPSFAEAGRGYHRHHHHGHHHHHDGYDVIINQQSNPLSPLA